MKKYCFYTWIICLLLLTFLLQACAQPASQAVNPSPEKTTVQVGYLPTMGYSPLFIAIDKGYFTEEGLDVQLQAFNSGAVMIAPLSTGQLDVGMGENGTALYNALHQGLDIKVVAPLSSQPRGYGAAPLLVRKDLHDSGEITGPADLKGKKIAVNIERGVSEYLVAEELAKAGLSVDDVELVAIPFPDMVVALANKAIDAAILGYPAAGKALKDGTVVVLTEGDEITENPQQTVVYIGKRLLDPANRQVAVRFLKVYLKAIRELAGEGWKSEENMAIISKYTEIPVPVIASSVMAYFDPNGKINMESLEKIQKYYLERGYTEYDTPLNLEEVVDLSYVKEAVEEIGEFKP